MAALRILVTGGAGFIGSALVRRLIGSTDSLVLNMDKLTYAGNLTSLDPVKSDPRYEFRRVDVCNADAIGSAFAEFRPDMVAHLAAETHVDRSIDGPAAFVQTNVVGTVNMLSQAQNYWRNLDGAARGRFRFLHVSTDEVFGSLGNEGFFAEATPYDPRSPYSASKASSDHFVRAWGHTYGLPILITNCSNNYGPYHFPEKLIPLMVIKGLAGEPLPIYGHGSHVRDWLHVEDHVRALTRVLEVGTPGETYLIGGRAERTNLEVVRQICRTLDALRPRPGGERHENLISFVADRPGHDLRYAIEPAKIERELDWTPTLSFEVGIESTVRWYLQNEGWWRPILDRAYKGERLGLGSSAESGIVAGSPVQ